MIFKQFRQVLDGSKTLTQRLNFTYEVGSVQAVVPRYLAPSVWWHPDTGEQVENPRDHLLQSIGYEVTAWDIKAVNACMTSKGYRPGKVRILEKIRRPVQDMTEEDCLAEGIVPFVLTSGAVRYEIPLFPTIQFLTPKDGYRYLWDSINKSKRLRWASNPVIVAVRFELVNQSPATGGEGV